ncbi:Chitin deacetylase [Colletotrichum shisoi]|uniref:Chitin deacetylase n=1 Tax=Colletotrichum shisoi TaxID=2078593 RepID=A0A5Q4BDS5_9PEZI|nr:Chitin deacetylase [Colletotrichum shisoi]
MYFAAVVTLLLVLGTAASPFERPPPFITIDINRNRTLDLPTQVPYGTVISSCTAKDTFALTFDDGPFTFTNHVLDLLASAGVRATFFVTGSLLSNIREQKAVIQRMLDEGHQVGHHTWSHADLAKISDKDVNMEMTKLEDAFYDIIGKSPTYMRPPYFSWNSATLSIMKERKYHFIRADIDTYDWKYNSYGNLTGLSLFQNGVDAGGTLALCHDVQNNTANVLLPKILDYMSEANLNGVPVGECLDDPETNWYKTKPIVIDAMMPTTHV